MNLVRKLAAQVRKLEFRVTHVDRMLVSGIVSIILGSIIFLYRFDPDLARFLLDISQVILILYVWANLKNPPSWS